jgi:hypothetical protein
MYDRPNAIKGRYLKIHNMLISVAARVNHEVIDLWRSFNIIYIMRTNEKLLKYRGSCGLQACMDPIYGYRSLSDKVLTTPYPGSTFMQFPCAQCLSCRITLSRMDNSLYA